MKNSKMLNSALHVTAITHTHCSDFDKTGLYQTLKGQYRCPSLTRNHCLIYAAVTVISPYHVGYYFHSLSQSKTATPIPCHVDRDDNCPFNASPRDHVTSNQIVYTVLGIYEL